LSIQITLSAGASTSTSELCVGRDRLTAHRVQKPHEPPLEIGVKEDVRLVEDHDVAFADPEQMQEELEPSAFLLQPRRSSFPRAVQLPCSKGRG
jgi:hypothetical protein